MTSKEKAIKAIQILEKLDDNVKHAFEVKAYFCRAAYENDIKSFFDGSTGAPGYNQITLSLYYDLIMTVVRVFDKLPNRVHADNTASLPELISLLRDNSTVEVLKEQERLARTLPNDLIKAEEVVDAGFLLRHKAEVLDKVNHFAKTIENLVGDYCRLNGSHYLRGLRGVSTSTGTVTVWNSLKPFKIRWLFQMTALSRQRLNGECPRIICQPAYRFYP
jgi:hypothetical protein